MNNRQRFFNILEGKPVDRTPYFPDISSWYEGTRKNFGEEQIFGPGVYIPDSHAFHRRESHLTGKMAKMTLVDYYREYDWGLPVHVYDWCAERYTGGVERDVKTCGKDDIHIIKTPKGDLQRTYTLDMDGTRASRGYWMTDVSQFDIMKHIIAHTAYSANFASAERFLRETEGFGVCDLPIARSPFGKLVHEYLGFENTVYALYDYENEVVRLLELQEEHDLELIEMAAQGPARIIIISDHADENLISPAHYQKYCVPFYKKARRILEAKGKIVSTHLDGNFKGYLPFIADAGFDLLDGCTPAPMFNYEVEDLSAAILGKINAYVGVPASMLLPSTDPVQAVAFGRRIIRAFNGRVIVNIGDILPLNGSIQTTIDIGMGIR